MASVHMDALGRDWRCSCRLNIVAGANRSDRSADGGTGGIHARHEHLRLRHVHEYRCPWGPPRTSLFRARQRVLLFSGLFFPSRCAPALNADFEDRRRQPPFPRLGNSGLVSIEHRSRPTAVMGPLPLPAGAPFANGYRERPLRRCTWRHIRPHIIRRPFGQLFIDKLHHRLRAMHGN